MPTRTGQDARQLDAMTIPASSRTTDSVGYAGGFVQRRQPLDDAGSWLAVNGSESNAVIIGGALELVQSLAQTCRDLGFVPADFPLASPSFAAIRRSSPLLTVVIGEEPGDDVLEMARSIRAVSATHIVILSVRSDPDEVLRGFDAGADDYIVLPIGPRELRARFEALVRRLAIRPPSIPARSPVDQQPESASTHPPQAAVRDPSSVLRGRVAPASEERWLRYGGLAVNPETRVVLVEQREVTLASEEFTLLATLLQSRRRVRNRSDLALVLRGEPKGQWYEVSDSEKAHIDECIGELRRKLEDVPDGPRYIEGSAEEGYRLSGDDRRPVAPDAPPER
ncbi:response regulator transcription factor [Microbacterium sp. NPDC089987]|uniref:response regulator transcription factor n=1 Tax=Microbacterium sp. NPDC089987 TaxID=3364202 RepID=UPI003830CCE4